MTTRGEAVRVRVVAFARLRELLGGAEREVVLPAADAGGAAVTPERVWSALGGGPELAALRATTRFARNGTLVAPDVALADGDELALLPPVGGG